MACTRVRCNFRPSVTVARRAQLRNPLHEMGGALTVMQSGDFPGGEFAREMRSLRRGVDVMCEITRDFLDIHALRSGALRLQEAWTNIRELLHMCASAACARVAYLVDFRFFVRRACIL